MDPYTQQRLMDNVDRIAFATETQALIQYLSFLRVAPTSLTSIEKIEKLQNNIERRLTFNLDN